MKKLRWLLVLMGITILAITGFQLYWLQENYYREGKSLAIKSEVAFRETIQHLQVAKLKLDWMLVDTMEVYMKKDSDQRMNFRVTPTNEIVSTINVINEKINDTIRKITVGKKGMMISMDNVVISKDSLKFNNKIIDPRNEHFLRMLYGVDSLQDSLRIREISVAYKKAMSDQKLDIPFSITRLDSSRPDSSDLNEVTVGFANPVTYRLRLGNTMPYLMKRISMPVLFSILLLGITVASFVLLYKALLKQQKLAELKNEFISNITHELKTPIATMGVAIEALKNFNALQDTDRTKEYLDISSNELERLNLLVDKVLKLSMFESEEVRLNNEPINMRELVDEVTRSMRLQLELHHASVQVTAEGSLNVLGDKLHLQSVIYNLLDNAIKYSRENPLININLAEQNEDLIIAVVDNGIGIPAEYKDRIFDKFFRVPHGDTHNAKGYGLGLSYVAHVVNKHRGNIRMESEPGIGTKFTITIPKDPNSRNVS